jgi:2-methylcitrate dehydratase PrpD
MPEQEQAGVTTQVGRFVTGTKTEDLPTALTERAAPALVDTVACMIGGWSAPEAGPLRRYLTARSGGADGLVAGWDRRTSTQDAALANGVLGAALEYDDVTRVLNGHPSVPVLSAVIAEAHRADLGGAEALAAYIIGVEVSVAIGRALVPAHTRRGWHPTATAGVFGAAAALARLRGLDTEQTTNAFGIAGSMAAGLKVNHKTMTKSLHSGWAPSSAMSAVELAAAGFTGARDVFEAPAGFVSVYGGEDSDPAQIVDRLGHPWLFIAPGDGLRIYPCHGATHRGLDAALRIREEHGLRAEDIEVVRHYHAPPWFRWVPRLEPSTGLEGKFSMEYILSAAMVDGQITIDSFTDEAVARPQVRRFFDRIELIEDPAYWPDDPYGGDPDRPPYEGFVRVEIVTRSGEVYAHENELPPGAPGRSLDRPALEHKYFDLVVNLGGVARARAARALSALYDLGGEPSLAEALAPLSIGR